jgi:hypothetical protein
MVLDALLYNVNIMGLVKVFLSCLLVVSDESQILSIEIQGLRIVIIDLA